MNQSYKFSLENYFFALKNEEHDIYFKPNIISLENGLMDDLKNKFGEMKAFIKKIYNFIVQNLRKYFNYIRLLFSSRWNKLYEHYKKNTKDYDLDTTKERLHPFKPDFFNSISSFCKEKNDIINKNNLDKNVENISFENLNNFISEIQNLYKKYSLDLNEKAYLLPEDFEKAFKIMENYSSDKGGIINGESNIEILSSKSLEMIKKLEKDSEKCKSICVSLLKSNKDIDNELVQNLVKIVNNEVKSIYSLLSFFISASETIYKLIKDSLLKYKEFDFNKNPNPFKFDAELIDFFKTNQNIPTCYTYMQTARKQGEGFCFKNERQLTNNEEKGVVSEELRNEAQEMVNIILKADPIHYHRGSEDYYLEIYKDWYIISHVSGVRDVHNRRMVLVTLCNKPGMKYVSKHFSWVNLFKPLSSIPQLNVEDVLKSINKYR